MAGIQTLTGETRVPLQHGNDANLNDITAHAQNNPQAVTQNVGTVATGSTVVERGNAYDHTSIITLATVLPAIAGGADLSVGKLLYTLPAGECLIKSAHMQVAITQSEGNIDADTPEVGLGSVIGSGAVAVLSTTLEDILTGQVAVDCDGAITVESVATPLVIADAGAHTIHLNVADGWAASGDLAAALTGTVIINWQYFANPA